MRRVLGTALASQRLVSRFTGGNMHSGSVIISIKVMRMEELSRSYMSVGGVGGGGCKDMLEPLHANTLAS